MGKTTPKYDKNSPLRAVYAEWLRYPTPEARRAAGLPATKTEFARKYHIDRVTQWRWENDPDFKRQVHNEALQSLAIDEVERIKLALKVKAFEGNVPAARLLLEWAGVFGKGATVAPAVDDSEIEKAIESMTEEQLLALLEAEDKEELALMKELDAV